MRWDLGFAGLGLLTVMSLAFGLIAHWIVGKGLTRWLWLFAGILYFFAGLLVSEVWFGWATERELQPNIDGLSFDEVQLVTLAGLVAALITRFVLRRKPHPKGPAQKPSS